MADLISIFGGPLTLGEKQEAPPLEHQIADAMLAAGLTPPHPIHIDGKLHRFRTGTKGQGGHGDKTGWYVFYPDGIAAGKFGCWRAGLESNWRAEIGRTLTPVEEVAHARRLAEAKAAREAEQAKSRAAAANTVEQIWVGAAAASPDHPYLARKGVQPHGARVISDGRLIVPLYGSDGALSSLQYIDHNGGKLYQQGGATGGKYWQIGTMDEPGTIYLAEGFATAATIHEATGRPCIVAYSASNLVPVCGAIREQFGSTQDLVIVADHDASGTGQKYADQASAKYGARVVMPPIEGDANDYLQFGHDLAALLSESRKISPTLSWPAPDSRFSLPELPLAPVLAVGDILGARLTKWCFEAAADKSAPPDYVFASLISAAGATIGNSRWVSPWRGWAEPPVIWAMCIGLPSAGKSPAIDAVLAPLRKVEKPIRAAAAAAVKEWKKKADLAHIHRKQWENAVKKAIELGQPTPAEPPEADAGSAPHVPRLFINDSTIERLGAILAAQPRGTLQVRDELAGWLEGMARYAGGGTDRPFWLEAYGGRSYVVERMSREPLTIDRLTIGVLGGIQPDRLKTLLFKTDDDGLLARFIPIWPEPVPPRRPKTWANQNLIEETLDQLHGLKMRGDPDAGFEPVMVAFSDDAGARMDVFRKAVRGWETTAEGLLLSFIGKLPGLAARVSLILGFLDSAAEGCAEPTEISADHFERAARLIESYVLPMARRCYADASAPKGERAARRLLGIVREHRWQSFSSREVLRLDRAGLRTADEINPALARLEEADCIRAIEYQAGARGGRPPRLYQVNPAILKGAE